MSENLGNANTREVHILSSADLEIISPSFYDEPQGRAVMIIFSEGLLVGKI